VDAKAAPATQDVIERVLELLEVAAEKSQAVNQENDVGTGDWDRQGRPSEVRLDRLLLVEPASVRREGATMNREVFDGVVAALRRHHS